MSNILFDHKSAYIVHKALEYKIQAKENMIVANVPDIADSFKEQLTKEREIFESFTGIVFMLSLDKELPRNINIGRKKAYVLLEALEDLIKVRKKLISENDNNNNKDFSNQLALETKVLTPIKTKVNYLWGKKTQESDALPDERRYLDYYKIS